MDPNNNPQPPPPAAPPPPPPVDPGPPAAPPVNPGMPPATGYSGGGILSGITLVGVGMIILTSLAFFYSIYYHRQAIKDIKATKTTGQNDMDEVKANLKSLMGENYKSF